MSDKANAKLIEWARTGMFANCTCPSCRTKRGLADALAAAETRFVEQMMKMRQFLEDEMTAKLAALAENARLKAQVKEAETVISLARICGIPMLSERVRAYDAALAKEEGK